MRRLIAALLCLALPDCDLPPEWRRAEPVAVGTYLGGGSIMFGSDPCTYAAVTHGVFDDGDAAKTGPRFIVAPGRIIGRCPKATLPYEAFVPTGVAISGPIVVKRGAESSAFFGNLTAGGRELEGKAAIDWTLGKDCEGVATFAPVLGASDTGGPDRTRTLVPAGPGTCTVLLTMTTGSEVLHPSFAPKTFTTQQRLAIQ
jgi:hypothetical protein